MANYHDLIKYENENISLDFKAIQYEKEQHEALIKDIMSMANADIENDRHIIIGVKHKPSGDKEIFNIEERDFKDPAHYQQIIRENIEGDIKLDYFPFEYEGKLLGILRVYGCCDQPYLMKKKFKKLKKGDSFIRKGTHVSRMTRRDLDRIYQEKMKRDKFDGKVQLSFSEHDGSPREIELTVAADVKLPSQIAAEKIKKIIKEKKELAKNKTQKTPLTGIYAFLESQQSLTQGLRRVAYPYTSTPYEQRSPDELEKNLKEVGQTYRDDDHYEFFELNSHKINISILNQGHTYIEDASIQVEIKKMDGLAVADRVYEEPKNNIINIPISPRVPSYESMNYPEVDYTKSSIIIYQTIGDVKHHIYIDAFRVPIRMVLLDQLAGEVIEIECKIFGKNLIEPLNEILRIKAISTIKSQ